MYEFDSCGDYYYCKEFIEAEKNWDLEDSGSYSWKYFWTIDLKEGYNIYWLPVAMPLKLMSMLYMKSFGGIIAIIGENPTNAFSDVIWPSTPITPEENPIDSTYKWRFAINMLTNTLTIKTMNFTHIWYDHGFFNFSITDLNSYQYKYNELTILPGNVGII